MRCGMRLEACSTASRQPNAQTISKTQGIDPYDLQDALDAQKWASRKLGAYQSMQSRITVDLALQALLMAVWRHKPSQMVIIHSDQGSQYTSREWRSFLHQHNLEASMSRRENCYDNAVAESFFQLLKRERIRRKTYSTRSAARQDVFEYIEMFYNPKRKHTYNGMLSPVDFETRHQKLKKAGV